MKKTNKKLFISLMAFALLFISLGATTFAWFTLSTTNIVDNIEFNISGGDGLNMSLDGQNFKVELKKEEVMAHIKELNGNKDVKLKPITTVDASTFYYEGAREESNQVKAENVNIDYVEFSIHFKIDNLNSNRNVGVYLYNYVNVNAANYDDPIAVNQTSVVSKGKEMLAGAKFVDSDGQSYEGNGTLTKYSIDALRIGFVDPKGEFATGGAGNHIYDFSEHPERGYGYGYNNIEEYEKVTGGEYDPSLNYKTKTGDTYTTVADDINSTNFQEYVDADNLYYIKRLLSYGAASWKMYKDKLSSPINEPAVKPDDNIMRNRNNLLEDSQIDPATNIPNNDGQKSLILKLTQSVDPVSQRVIYSGYVKVKIWIEGWDADCFDIIAKDLTKIQLAFRVAYIDDIENA